MFLLKKKKKIKKLVNSDNIGHQKLSLYGQNIYIFFFFVQNIFCVSQKKESQTGLEWRE